jgi:surface antigen
MLWYNTNTLKSVVWFMNGNRVSNPADVLYTDGRVATPGTEWKSVGTGDMNRDGKADMLWYNTNTLQSVVWFMNGNRASDVQPILYGSSPATLGAPWKIVGNGDMNGDGKADMLWYNTSTLKSVVWFMNGNRVSNPADVLYLEGRPATPGPEWQTIGVGRFGVATPPTGIDDYPYSTPKCYPSGSCESDPWGMTKQQCVSFVAWRLSQRGVIVDGAYGNAENWDDEAIARNKTVDNTPAIGAVAQYDAEKADSTGFKAGPLGHVAYVTAVNTDGTVNVEEYNQSSKAFPDGDQSYHQRFSVKANTYIHF